MKTLPFVSGKKEISVLMQFCQVQTEGPGESDHRQLGDSVVPSSPTSWRDSAEESKELWKWGGDVWERQSCSGKPRVWHLCTHELRQALRSVPLSQPLQTWLSNTSSPLEVGLSDLRGTHGRGSLTSRHTQHALSPSHAVLLMENNMAQLYGTTVRNLQRLIARRGCVLSGVCLH